MVISVISVMVALLLPSLQTSRESAKQTKCMNNLRQIGIGMNLYGHDHGFYMWGIESNTVASWSYRISPYLGMTNGDTFAQGHNGRSPIVECPGKSLNNGYLASCYGVHTRIFGDSTLPLTYPAPYFPRQYPFDERASEVMMCADADQNPASLPRNANATIWNMGGGIMATDFVPATGNNVVDCGDNSEADPAQLSQIRFRHNSRANLLFMDGHVGSFGRNQVLERNVRITGP